MIPEVDSHAKALLEALISTGKVIKLKIVVTAYRIIPMSSSDGKLFISNIPPRITHVIHLDEKLTIGTNLERKPSHE